MTQEPASRPSAQVHRPSALPSNKRRPRYVLGTFWTLIAVICLIAGFTGLWWAIVLGLLCIGYAVYLFRGGRFGFWFF